MRNVLLAAYLVTCALGLTGVLFRGVMTADARVLGLPAGLAWVTGLSVTTFLALWAYDATRPDDAESDAPQGEDADRA